MKLKLTFEHNFLFRLRLKAHMTPAKAKKGGAAPAAVEAATHCTVYVAKSYPAWQCTILDTMREMHNKGVTDKKAISVEMGKSLYVIYLGAGLHSYQLLSQNYAKHF